MIDAHIHEGDILIVDRAVELIHGKVVIAVTNGEFTVKTLYKKDNIIKLVPANSDYSEILLPGE